EGLADLLERADLAVVETEPEPDHVLLAWREMTQRLVHRVVQHDPGSRVVGYHGLAVLDEIGEAEILLVPHRLLERDGVLVDPLDLAYAFDGEVHPSGHFLGARL